MRAVSRVVAAVTALVLAAAAIAVLAEIVVTAAGHQQAVLHWHRWHDDALTHAWSSPAVRQIGFGLVAAGLLMVVVSLAGRRPVVLPLRRNDGRVTPVVHRRSLEQTLAADAGRIDGVAKPKARIAGSRLRVRASTARHDTTGLAPAVQSRLEDRIAGIHLDHRPAIEVKLHRSGA